MNIVLIHGQRRKIGTNYNISHQLLDLIKNENSQVQEFFVNDIPFCKGCMQCVLKGEDKCPDRDTVSEIIDAFEKADILIINSPTYCMEMTGQLKTFFDHMAYRYIVHRPHLSMKNKTAILISTAAGGGSKRVINSLKNQMMWFGIKNNYSMNFNVYAESWNGVKDEIKQKIAKKVNTTVKKVKNKNGKKAFNPTVSFRFFLMKKLRYKLGNELDIQYWKDNSLL